MTEESIFAEALAIGSPRERAAFLDRVCDDAAVRKEVEALLAAHAVSNPLDQPPVALARTGAYESETDGPAAAVGDRVGPYKLLERIGEGGMGEVWVADQLEPIKRRVALKLIKPGMDSRAVLARFEAERQALAVMDHPNIAKVLDAGTTPDGRPYFVMELVKGTPITEFCDARKLSPRERLELFIPVCQAIQHAHMKGIIHRDIKPSNVLVALHDETPVPKVIDFGVAKAIGQQLTEKTIYTGFGALIGTPAYMAPEQATFNQLDVDTRADVYALGVLLYELLTGSPPVEPERLKKAALDEVLRIVRDEEPQRPSQRLSTSQAKATIAAVRQSDPAKLSDLLRGEVDWIVMKALEKDRTRRYDTATALAKDVQRYLSGDAVEACPPTLGYRLWKAYRRNRAAVLIGGAFAFVLLAATAVSGWLAVKASHAEELAKAKRIEAEENAAEAEKESNARAYTLGVLSSREEQLRLALAESAIDKLSLQIDLDLAESASDSRTGLLRLARTLEEGQPIKVPPTTFIGLENDPNEYQASRLQDLRTFATVAILSTGQNYAPLRRPIMHDGFPPTHREPTPEGRTLLTADADGTARLWNVASGTSIALLREQRERVKQCGLSPDGRTAFTTDEDGVVRLWDVPEGKLRGKTEPWTGSQHDHRARPVKLSNHRLLTMGAKGKEDVVELRDSRTGRKIADLDREHFWPFLFQRFGFTGGDRYLVGHAGREGRSPVLHVFSADTGSYVGRLLPPMIPNAVDTKFHIGSVAASPSGKRFVATVEGDHITHYWFWTVDSWKESPVASFKTGQRAGWLGVSFRSEDVFEITDELSKYVIRFGTAEEEPLHRSGLLPAAGDVLCQSDGTLLDARTGQRLYPPPGRRYHPDLARFAPDGRLVNTADLIDIRADKLLAIGSSLRWSPIDQSLRFFPGSGFVVAEDPSRVLRSTNIDIPPKLLNLWAQVAVCGELGPDGSFRKWDERTWDLKRRELAAHPSPIADFPFPGHVAADSLHWLRSEFGEDKTEPEKQRIARELMARCELIGDPEAARWRAEVGRQFAPSPREAKP